MKSIFRRFYHYTKPVSKDIYEKHKDKFLSVFGESIPSYDQVFDWINDASGIAVIIYISEHIEWDNRRSRYMPSKTSLPVFKAQAFHYGELIEGPETFVDDWDGCADYAIDTALSKIYDNEKIWIKEFTEEYDGSSDEYDDIDEYIEAMSK